MERGKDLAVRRFRSTSDDAIKADAIFQNSKHFWASIEEEVRGWVESSWSKWVEEESGCLDDNMKAKTPEEWIPNAEDRQRERERRESVRRASIRRQSVR